MKSGLAKPVLPKSTNSNSNVNEKEQQTGIESKYVLSNNDFCFDKLIFQWPENLKPSGGVKREVPGGIHVNTTLEGLPEKKYITIYVDTPCRFSPFIPVVPQGADKISNIKTRLIVHPEFPKKTEKELILYDYVSKFDEKLCSMLDENKHNGKDPKMNLKQALLKTVKDPKIDFSRLSDTSAKSVFSVLMTPFTFEYDVYTEFDAGDPSMIGNINREKSEKIPIILWTRNRIWDPKTSDYAKTDRITIPDTDKEILTSVYDYRGCTERNKNPREITTWKELKELLIYEKGSGQRMFYLVANCTISPPTAYFPKDAMPKWIYKMVTFNVYKRVEITQSSRISPKEIENNINLFSQYDIENAVNMTNTRILGEIDCGIPHTSDYFEQQNSSTYDFVPENPNSNQNINISYTNDELVDEGEEIYSEKTSRQSNHSPTATGIKRNYDDYTNTNNNNTEDQSQSLKNSNFSHPKLKKLKPSND